MLKQNNVELEEKYTEHIFYTKFIKTIIDFVFGYPSKYAWYMQSKIN